MCKLNLPVGVLNTIIRNERARRSLNKRGHQKTTMVKKANQSLNRLKPNGQKSEISISPRLQNGYHSDRRTWPYIYHRLFGYSIGAAVHLGNILAMGLALRGPIMKDPDIEHFYSMRFVYITIWNLVFQLIYIGIGFTCDLPIVLEMKNSKFLDWLRWYRKTYYNGTIWPCGMIILTVFWPFFCYDRNLLYPYYIDNVLSPISNYIMHMFIIIPIVSDLFFLPNQKQDSQKYTIAHCGGTFFVYIIVISGFYTQYGKWPYPIMKLVYGTVYFPLLFIVVLILLVILYLIQWPLISLIWRNKTKLL